MTLVASTKDAVTARKIIAGMMAFGALMALGLAGLFATIWMPTMKGGPAMAYIASGGFAFMSLTTFVLAIGLWRGWRFLVKTDGSHPLPQEPAIVKRH